MASLSMTKFYLKVVVYLISFAICMFALNGLDFNRFLKKGKIAQGQTLYFVIAMIMAYLLGNFFMSVIYYFNV